MPTAFKEILKEFPHDTQSRIEHNRIPQKKVDEDGIELLAPDEIFVRLPGKIQDYLISSYGRTYSMKDGTLRYIEPSTSGDYKTVSLYQRPDNRKRYPKGKQKTYTVQALMGIAFLPNYWESKAEGRQLQVHHCDHNPHNNYWKNLVRLPIWLHRLLDDVQQVWLRSPGKQQFRRRTYYEIAELTGETLDEIINRLKEPEEFIAEQGERYLRCYDSGGYTIGFEMTSGYNNR